MCYCYQPQPAPLSLHLMVGEYEFRSPPGAGSPQKSPCVKWLAGEVRLLLSSKEYKIKHHNDVLLLLYAIALMCYCYQPQPTPLSLHLMVGVMNLEALQELTPP